MSINTISTSGTISQSGATITFFPTSGGSSTLDFTAGVTINSGASVKLTTDLSFSTVNQYFIIGSAGITFDGSGNKITVIVASYPGVFSCTNASNSANINNLGVVSTSIALATYGGWVVRGYSAYNGYDANITCNTCYSNGDISTAGSGGIFGTFSAGTAISCYSSGAISSTSCGGIFGQNSRNCKATSCYSTSASLSGNGSGGIFGSNCNSCTANYCNSIGTMAIANTGGIFGLTSTTCTANYCYSTGSISSNTSGGIFSASTSATANYCRSTGNMTIAQCGGIVRSGSGNVVNYCYSTGTIIGDAGGICGIYGVSDTNLCTANFCYSTGTIGGGGGIFAGSGIANSCYSTGAISVRGGGIVGRYSCNNSIATNCYSTGSITNGSGIFGEYAGLNGTSRTCTAIQCYSTGVNTSSVSNGGIFSTTYDASSNVIATNCYSTSGNTLSTSGGIFATTNAGAAGTPTYCYCTSNATIGGTVSATNIGSSTRFWVDASANLTIGNGGTTNWAFTTVGTPWLLSTFNQALYDPSFNTISDSAQTYTSSSGLFTTTSVYSGSPISPTYNLVSVTIPKYTPTINATTGVLTFTHPEGSIVCNLFCYYTYNSNYVGYSFSAFTLTAPIPCFLIDTKIKVSPTEYALVQDLKEGDLVYTSDGREVPILKINQYSLLPNSLYSPYVIPKGYRYGDFVCDQDLYLSPEHAVLIDSENFVPVKALGFQQDTTLTHLTYFHITLPNFFTDHLVANGIPSESYSGESAIQSNGNYISMYFNHEIFKKVYDKQHFIRKNLTLEKYTRIVESTTINLPIHMKALPTYEVVPESVDFNFIEEI